MAGAESINEFNRAVLIADLKKIQGDYGSTTWAHATLENAIYQLGFTQIPPIRERSTDEKITHLSARISALEVNHPRTFIDYPRAESLEARIENIERRLRNMRSVLGDTIEA